MVMFRIMYILTTLEFPKHNHDFHVFFRCVYMEASLLGCRDELFLAFITLYGSFHPACRDEI